MKLLRRARETQFARDHSFSTIRTVEDFQAQVPLRRYDDFWQEYWGKSYPYLRDVTWPGSIPYFARTSGTSLGVSKNIPVSPDMLRSNERAAVRTLARHLADNQKSKILLGKILLLGGSTGLQSPAPGVHCGDLSGISSATYPLWARLLASPSREVARIPDWTARMEIILEDPKTRRVRAIAGQTTWLLAFLERALQATPGAGSKLEDAFPRLELMICGGMNFAPYQSRLTSLAGSGRIAVREVYVASEGFIAIGEGFPGSGMRPILDNGLFLEFVPLSELDSVSPRRFWLETVEPGVDYAIAVSSNAGLWAYLIGDVVRFAHSDLKSMMVVGRCDQMMSPFGEHVLEVQLTEALMRAGEAAGTPIKEYAAGPSFPSGPNEAGNHLYIVEFENGEPDEAARRLFLDTADAALKAANHDYGDLRMDGVLIKGPELLVARHGAFEAWMKRRGKLGGQNKIPRIILNPELLEDLRRHVASFGRTP